MPHGEPTPLVVRLRDDSQWQPTKASVLIGEVTTKEAQLEDQAYAFELPPQVESTPMQLTVGDFYQDVIIEPKHRPELVAVDAQVSYPEYLGRDEKLKVDVRSGVLSVVAGSLAQLEATASRSLQTAAVHGQEVKPEGESFASTAFEVAGDEIDDRIVLARSRWSGRSSTIPIANQTLGRRSTIRYSSRIAAAGSDLGYRASEFHRLGRR